MVDLKIGRRLPFVAHLGHGAMSDLSLLCAAQRTLTGPSALVLYVSLNDASQALTRADA